PFYYCFCPDTSAADPEFRKPSVPVLFRQSFLFPGQTSRRFQDQAADVLRFCGNNIILSSPRQRKLYTFYIFILLYKREKCTKCIQLIILFFCIFYPEMRRKKNLMDFSSNYV